jgi:hypothetical protein
MKRLVIVAALVLSTGAAMAGPCDGPNCAPDDPAVTMSPQAASHLSRRPQPSPPGHWGLWWSWWFRGGQRQPLGAPVISRNAISLMSTGAAMVVPCSGADNCATDDPVVTTPPQGCGGRCVLPEPEPFQTAEPCDNANCVLPEDPISTV